MAWWGTLLGGTLGYMFGGPLGALLGAALGRNFDRGIRVTDERAAYDVGQQERVQAAFFTACFSIMGHIAKADGKVTAAEISSAEAIMARKSSSACSLAGGAPGSVAPLRAAARNSCARVPRTGLPSL